MSWFAHPRRRLAVENVSTLDLAPPAPNWPGTDAVGAAGRTLARRQLMNAHPAESESPAHARPRSRRCSGSIRRPSPAGRRPGSCRRSAPWVVTAGTASPRCATCSTASRSSARRTAERPHLPGRARRPRTRRAPRPSSAHGDDAPGTTRRTPSVATTRRSESSRPPLGVRAQPAAARRDDRARAARRLPRRRRRAPSAPSCGRPASASLLVASRPELTARLERPAGLRARVEPGRELVDRRRQLGARRGDARPRSPPSRGVLNGPRGFAGFGRSSRRS